MQMYYEEAAHLLRMLMVMGFRPSSRVSYHFAIATIASGIKRYMASNDTHAVAAEKLLSYVTFWTDGSHAPDRKNRLIAVIGTSLGNIAAAHRRQSGT